MSPRDPYPPYPGELPGEGPRPAPQQGPPQQAQPERPATAPSSGPGPRSQPAAASPAGHQPPSAPPPPPEGEPERPGTVTAALWVMAAGAAAYVALQAYVVTRFDVLRDDLEAQLAPPPGVPRGPGDGFFEAMMVGLGVMTGFFTLVVLLLWTWMIVANARGLGWARITATCLAGYNALSTVFTVGIWALTRSVSDGPAAGFGATAAQDTTSMVLALVQALLGIVAAGLLWLGPSGDYVRAVGRQRARDRWEAAPQAA